MKPLHIISVLLALLFAAFSYSLIRTNVIDAPSEVINDGSRVEISFVEDQSTAPQRIVTVMDERGAVTIMNGDGGSTRPVAALQQQSRAGVSPPQNALSEADEAPLWSSTKSMSAQENAHAHWVKHRAEFPEYRTANEYIKGAKAFFNSPPPGTLTKVRNNGDRLFFNPQNGTFGVQTGSGAPRTMFRPRNGMEYWRKQ